VPPAGILLDFDRPRLAAPDDAAQQSKRYPLHLAGVMISTAHHPFCIPVQNIHVICRDRHLILRA
jgi:hypothetical protein